jgi:hypothetical protein
MMVKKKKIGEPKPNDILATLEILLHNNGNVTVTGPINNPIAVMDMLSRGLKAIADHFAKQAMEKEKSNIITPDKPKIVTLN